MAKEFREVLEITTFDVSRTLDNFILFVDEKGFNRQFTQCWNRSEILTAEQIKNGLFKSCLETRRRTYAFPKSEKHGDNSLYVFANARICFNANDPSSAASAINNKFRLMLCRSSTYPIEKSTFFAHTIRSLSIIIIR